VGGTQILGKGFGYKVRNGSQPPLGKVTGFCAHHHFWRRGSEALTTHDQARWTLELDGLFAMEPSVAVVSTYPLLQKMMGVPKKWRKRLKPPKNETPLCPTENLISYVSLREQ
jgi:hypothetical protein